MSKKKFVLIDGNSIAFRAFYALPLLNNSKGIYTNAVYGFAMMLMKILEEEQPTHLLVAFDAGKSTFRHDLYPEYKGTREKTPHELSEQIPLIHECLDAFGIRHEEQWNIEADDIIGTCARQAEKENIETVIISGDKDLLQLVSDRIVVLLPRKGITEADRYDQQAVLDRYGLTPEQITDLKGLMGDPSDHIPGIPGVGEKTAIKLLKQYPTVEEVLAHIDKLPGKKLKEKIRAHKEQALLSKELATIKCDLPLDFSIEDCMYSGIPKKEKVVELFQELEFHSLLERIPTSEDEQPSSTLTAIDFEMVTIERLDRFEGFFKQELLSFHVETDHENPHHGKIIGFACSDGNTQLYIPYEVASTWTSFQEWLTASDRRKVVYDCKKTKIVLQRASLSIQGLDFDLHLADYLLDPTESKRALSDLVNRYLPDFDLPSDESVYGKGAKRQFLQGERLAEHLARKTAAIFYLFPRIKDQLATYEELISLYEQLEFPLAEVLAEMELNGIQVDQQCLLELGDELKQRMDQLEEEIHQIAGYEFNINSPKQLGEVLFDRLHLPVIKKTKTGYSTSADVLEKLAPQHEIVEKILHYRQVGKLFSTYIEGLKKEIHPDGKIHTQFQQTITATGRLSSTNPNLQNIPIRLEEGRRIRRIFVPSSEYQYLMAADYSQVELRVLAHLSGDEELKQAFREGRDIHTQTAVRLFEVEEDDVTPHMRRQAKAVNFGIIYGISDFGLSQNLQIPRKEAKGIIDRYFSTYPKVKEYLDSLIQQARENGYVTTMLGRRRYLPEIHSRNFNRRSFAERTAMNTPIQGTAADIIKQAMVQLVQEIKKHSFKSRLLLQVHDELILEVKAEELSQIRQLVKRMMESSIPLSIPLKVDISIGENWYLTK